MKILSDLNVSGKKVFLRADLDVNVENSKLETPTSQAKRGERNSKQEEVRLQNLKPTVDYLLDHAAKQIIIAGHIDRPHKPDPSLSTSNLEAPLEQIFKRSVTFKPDFNTEDGTIASLAQLVLLENLRFWPGEETNDPDFVKQLASLADVYVNDAFGVSHRSHASMVGLPLLFPDVEDPDGVHSRRAAGLHLAKEIEVLGKLLESPARPFVAIIGGAKIETKLPVIANLAKVADWVLVGGAIAKEFQISNILPRRQAGKFQIEKNEEKIIVADLTDNGKDIDDVSINRFVETIKKAKTIVWNGPLGLFEEGFDKGTITIAEAIIGSGAYSVVGGGETTQFLGRLGVLGRFGFVSAGGGAMLEFLAGKELPGLKALD